MTSGELVWAGVLVLTLMAAAMDWRTRKIPNWITMPAWWPASFCEQLSPVGPGLGQLGGFRSSLGFAAPTCPVASLGRWGLETHGCGWRIHGTSPFSFYLFRKYFCFGTYERSSSDPNKATKGNVPKYCRAGARIHDLRISTKSPDLPGQSPVVEDSVCRRGGGVGCYLLRCSSRATRCLE